MELDIFGKFIAQCRKELGYTQEMLGARLGVTDKAVSKWERGLSCPDILLLGRLSTELKVTLPELLNCERMTDVKNSNSIFSSCTDEIEHSSLLDAVVNIDGYCDGSYYVSPLLFGNNLEHTRTAVSGGISAQILRNRKFVGFQSQPYGVAEEWYRIGEKSYCCFSQKKAYTRHLKEYYHMSRRFERNSQSVRCFEDGELSGIGQKEISIKAGIEYDVAVVVRASDDVSLTVSLTSRGGEKIYGSDGDIDFYEISGQDPEKWLADADGGVFCVIFRGELC